MRTNANFMRIKIFAILLLLVLVGLPGSIYWYLFSRNVSGIAFVVEGNTEFRVKLSGKFSFKYFPLFDKIFEYESLCHGSCIFSPIPPILYDVTLSSSGYAQVNDRIKLSLGTVEKYYPKLVPTLVLERVGHIDKDSAYSELLRSDISSRFWPRYDLIWEDRSWTPFVLRNLVDQIMVGKISGDTISRIWTLPWVPVRAFLDQSRSSSIFEKKDSSKLITSLDWKKSASFPSGEDILFASYNDSWMVRTSWWVYERESDLWIKNPRFTDMIDMSDRYRIGYIDQHDEKKLSLAWFPWGQSIIFLVDRMTGDSFLLEKWRNIQGFFSHDGEKFFLDPSWDIYRMTLPM